MNNLKPCPFCGRESFIKMVSPGNGDKDFWFPECSDPEYKCAGGMMDEMAYESEQDAVEAWNQRVFEEQLNKLIYAVARKFPGETRFETALRYIEEAETSNSEPTAKVNEPTRI